MRKIHAKRFLLTLAKWLLSGGMLAYVLHEMDFSALGEILTRQKPAIVMGAFALIILQLLVSTLRWQRIMRALLAQTPPYGHLLKLNFIGMFFNCCLPGTIGGDVVRSMMLRAEHRPLSLCVHGVMIDRAVAIGAVFVMVVIGLPWMMRIVPNLPAQSLYGVFVLLAVMGVALLYYAPRFAHHALIGKIARLLVSARRIVFSLPDIVLVVLHAVGGHSLFCLAVAMLVASLGGTLSFADSLLLVPLVLLLTTLPISVGGWGVRELGMVGLLALVGVPKPVALAVSVQLGMLQIIASLPGAWIYLRSRATRD